MSSESHRTQCSCANHNFKCKKILFKKLKIIMFVLAPLTPCNWKLGRKLGQGNDVFNSLIKNKGLF
jgi:hypothetical protein